ncbi:4-hydroxy-tetrahydrodipicolinate synthase [Petroclostridium sp. X23]|jgi:4-hydroxy-tetrahydrodipicolinate synthase|uniref:4-hydroxy-tetrahydrodipicolinate synthase n=1 Tax=Petroclostridium sp. X23 TaxID=3045146 RepID=UPI0024ADF8FC|nr:4-hydroxy-tetrahydrodipicolinate synthase [Petroclostridium sp. X23]WHH59023.1 4-hydroxy-tetrahydrodipicolinate synthase [Petroclostridium sp. X23]
MKKTLFTGSGVAIVTPFTNDGVDFEKLGELLEFQIAEKTDAIIICGTTGEASTMPDDEHKEAIKYTVDKVAGRIPVIAGTGSNDTQHCIDLSKYSEEIGADGLLIVTPYYNKTTQKGLIAHFTAVANSVKIPIILYNVPGRTGLNITPQTLKTLSQIENIIGIKEASGNISQIAQMVALCGDDMDFYTGNDDMIVPMLSLGGKGVISVVANIAPKATHDIVEKYLSGDVQGSRDLQLKMLDLINSLFVEVNPIPVKTAMNLLGYNVGKLRMPLTDMSEKNLEILKKALTDYGFSLK